MAVDANPDIIFLGVIPIQTWHYCISIEFDLDLQLIMSILRIAVVFYFPWNSRCVLLKSQENQQQQVFTVIQPLD